MDAQPVGALAQVLTGEPPPPAYSLGSDLPALAEVLDQPVLRPAHCVSSDGWRFDYSTAVQY